MDARTSALQAQVAPERAAPIKLAQPQGQQPQTILLSCMPRSGLPNKSRRRARKLSGAAASRRALLRR